MKKFVKKQRITTLDLVDGSFKQSPLESQRVQHPSSLQESQQSDKKKQAVNSSMDSIEEEIKPNNTAENINSKQHNNSPIILSQSQNLNLSIHPFNQRVESSFSSNRRIQQQYEDSQIGKDMSLNTNGFPLESQFLQYNSQHQDMNWWNVSQPQNNQINSSFLRENNSNQYAQTNRLINLPQNYHLSYESQRQSNNFSGQIINNNFPIEAPFTQQNSILSTQMTLKESQEQTTFIEMELKQEIAEELQSVKKYFETAIKNEVASFSQNYSSSEESYGLILKNLTNRIEQTLKIVNTFTNNMEKKNKNKKKKSISSNHLKEILKLKEIIKKTEIAVSEQSQNSIIGSTELISHSTKAIRSQILKAKVSLKKQLRDQRKFSILAEKRKQGNRGVPKL